MAKLHCTANKLGSVATEIRVTKVDGPKIVGFDIVLSPTKEIAKLGYDRIKETLCDFIMSSGTSITLEKDRINFIFGNKPMKVLSVNTVVNNNGTQVKPFISIETYGDVVELTGDELESVITAVIKAEE